MAKARTELVHCDNCGEDYAATYRRCPFCNNKTSQRQDEYDDDYDYDDAPRRGGKRLAGGSPSGGGDPAKIAIYALAALVLLAVICILLSVVIPKLVAPAPSASPAASDAPVPSEDAAIPSAAPSEPVSGNTDDPGSSFHPLPVIDGMGDDDPLDQDSPNVPPVEPDPVSSALAAASSAPTPTSTPAASQPPASQAPSGGLTIRYAGRTVTDFSITAQNPEPIPLTVQGGTAASWQSKNTGVATVSDRGVVTAVGNGNTTITVTDQNGNTASAIVRVSGVSGAQPSASQAPSSQAPSGNAKLNHTDFSITASYPDPIRLRVQGGEAAGWKSANTKVATVSDNGTVTGVGNGSTKITCTLTDGSTLTCDVHVSGL